MRFVIMTGVSGAGKSQAVKYLEDIGYFCVDNLPPLLIPKFAELCLKAKGKMQRVALVIDIRGGEFLNDFFPSIEALREAGLKYEILFLEASDEVLIKRFKESRRTHPLAPEGRLIVGISEERKILEKIKDKAHHIINTSNLNPRQLKEEIANIYVEDKKFEGLIISIISFGFKYGIPIDCDLVFDVRFIPNPYYIETMKKLTGQDDPVKQFVLLKDETIIFIKKLNEMLEFLIPYYVKEGKNQLVIGIGCTGGRHRSVAIGESVHNSIQQKQHRVVIDHRDIDKDGRSKAT